VINTRNWNYYYLKIKEAAFVNSLSTEFQTPVAEKAQENLVENYHKKTQRLIRILNAFTLLCIIVHQAILIWLIWYNIAHPNVIGNEQYAFTGATYLLLAAYFSFTSLNIIRELKCEFKFFYEENRK
jgi:hypothetical protein